MVKDAIFASFFCDGREVLSPCKVNTETKEVFDVEIKKIDFLGFCYEESVFIDNVEYSICDVNGALYFDKEKHLTSEYKNYGMAN